MDCGRDGQERVRPGEMPARHRDRAMWKLDAEREIGGISEHAERLHELGRAAMCGNPVRCSEAGTASAIMIEESSDDELHESRN